MVIVVTDNGFANEVVHLATAALAPFGFRLVSSQPYYVTYGSSTEATLTFVKEKYTNIVNVSFLPEPNSDVYTLAYLCSWAKLEYHVNVAHTQEEQSAIIKSITAFLSKTCGPLLRNDAAALRSLDVLAKQIDNEYSDWLRAGGHTPQPQFGLNLKR